jgi:hypothetical protein
MEIFKKGDLVQVKVGGHNASDFNKDGLDVMGIYKDRDKCHENIYTIEGTLKLITFDHSPSTYGAYLLSLNGVPQGYVYNYALTLVNYKECLLDEFYIKGMVDRQPIYKGKGNYSISQLETICEQYGEYAHQQKIIKQICMETIVKLKFASKP